MVRIYIIQSTRDAISALIYNLRKDATLTELITTLRITSSTPEFRHPLAKFFFRALYADSMTKGHFSQKDLGQLTSRELLEENGSLSDDNNGNSRGKTLEELRFIPGDYLCIAVHLPKNVNLGSASTTNVLSIKGSASAAADKWSRGTPQVQPPGGLGRGGAHWRARPGIAGPTGRGGGDDGRTWRGRDRDSPPPRTRRSSPPRSRPPIPERDRGLDKPRLGRRSRSRSRSRPRSRSPRRRSGRYD